MLKYIPYKTVEFYTSKLLGSVEDKHSVAAPPQWCFIRKLLLKSFQNSVENICIGVLSCRPETCNFIKKETPCLFLNFAKFLRSLFLENNSGGCF